MDFDKHIHDIEKSIGYVFRDKSLLRQAFTRTSYCNEHKRGLRSNEVLEFFGDSILSSAIVTLFIKEYSSRYEHGIKADFAEGEFTVIRSRLSDKKGLSGKIKELGLQAYLLMGEGDAKLGIQDEPSVMEDLFESIIGAVYIDSDMNMPRVIAVVKGLIDISAVLKSTEQGSKAPLQSSKNQLQEWCADKKRRLPAPVYKTVGESGPEHKKLYERACYIGEELYAVGKGKNQKAADADAAAKALARLAEEERARSVKAPDMTAVGRLKEYSRTKKLPTPEFRDMGEVDDTRGGVKCAVVCSLKGVSKTGVAEDKSAARALAAEAVLAELKGAEKKDTPPRVKKKTQNQNKPRKSTLRKGKPNQSKKSDTGRT